MAHSSAKKIYHVGDMAMESMDQNWCLNINVLPMGESLALVL
jgi:hypothetical protein